MKVKFRLHDSNFLRFKRYPEESIRKVPFFLFVDKEFSGELIGNNIHHGNYIFPSEFCTYIKPED